MLTARHAAGWPKLAFLPLMQPPAHASTTILSYRRGCGCMWAASGRKGTAYSSLLRRLDAVHTDREAMQARLSRSRLAEACVPPARATARLESTTILSYRRGCGCMWAASERKGTAYSSLLRRLDAVHTDREAMQARLTRSRLA